MSDSLRTRREFLEFFGRSTAALGLTSFVSEPIWAAPAREALKKKAGKKALRSKLPFQPVPATSIDTMLMPDGFNWKVVASWGDPLNNKGESFGFNNDYLAFTPLNKEGTDGVLWSNHESANPLFVSGWSKNLPRTKEQVVKEQMAVGGSLVRIRKDATGVWKQVPNDPLNRRLDGRTPIPLICEREIMGSKTAIGTLANCAGGVTPWKTILTCEENYHDFYGEAVYEAKAKNRHIKHGYLRWEEFFDYSPEHYGWVVEVEPMTGAAKKLTALGRFGHEGATTTLAKDGRCVVYMGDDANDRCLYKFISDKTGSLETGTLYVANLAKQVWVPLKIEAHEVLKKNFVDQTDVLIRCREAAPMVGGSPLDRPEDIEIDAKTGAVFVALTNNKARGNNFGAIMKLVEKNNDPLALEFESSTFLAGGECTGFACPDNLIFDRKGNLWMTTDIAGSAMHKAPYEAFGNNSLFYIPLSGPNAGKAFRVAVGPHDAELTGPCFSPDGRTLFLSVQHPGEESKSAEQPTSHWPGGGNTTPKPSVIAISGPMMDALVL